MNQPIGHDINGRPLRVGDEVVLVWVNDPDTVVNERVTITGAEHCHGYDMIQYDGFYLVVGEQLRKLHDDHRPANESFGEMMEGLVGNKRVGA